MKRELPHLDNLLLTLDTFMEEVYYDLSDVKSRKIVDRVHRAVNILSEVTANAENWENKRLDEIDKARNYFIGEGDQLYVEDNPPEMRRYVDEKGRGLTKGRAEKFTKEGKIDI